MTALENLLAKASSWYAQGKPFALYARPGATALEAVFQRGQVCHRLDEFHSDGFAFVSFDGRQQLLIPFSDAETSSSAISGESPTLADRPMPVDEKAQSRFEALVTKAVGAIREGNFEKVVLSRSERLDVTGDFAAIFHRMLLTYPSAFRYCWFHPETGVWIGATPEQLLKTERGVVKTVALAGTQRFIDTEHVLWQEKEKTEQQFVTDFIVDGLRPMTTAIDVSQPYTARAGNLLHIKTDISGTLREDCDLFDVISTLHPTPAVCGYPKAAARQFILENENYDREFYSGFVGEIGRDASDLYVNLRCMKFEDRSAQVYVGCGITAASDPSSEFFETANKALTMKKIVL